MRKVLSFVLVLTLVLSSFSMAFAATPASAGLSDVAGNANEDAIQVAYDLGIVTGNPDGTFLPEKAVNRAEFAAMITRALAIPDSALAGYTATSFKDTAGYGWAVPYLAFCQSKGILLGDGAGNVMPGRTINTNEAMTMVLRALGYTSNSAALVGTWPANYVTLAQEKELYDSVTSTGNVNKANAAQMIYNSLTVDKVEVATDGTTTATGTTLIEAGLNCDAVKGVIGGDITNDSKINLSKYQGVYGTAYVNSDSEVVAFDASGKSVEGDWTVDAGSTIVGYLDADKDYEFAAGAEEYSTNPANHNSLTSSTAIYYFENGVADGTTTIGGLADDNTYTFNGDISGKTIKEIYSVSKWDSTADDKVGADDVAAINDDQSLLGEDFTLNDDDEIDLNSFTLVGVSSLDKIAKDNVVYVYTDGTDNEIQKVAVGTEQVTGKVTKKTSDSIYVGGKEYEFTSNNSVDVEGAVTDMPVAGDDVTLYLDAYGDIYDYDVNDSTPDTYGVVKAFGLDSLGDATMRLFNSDGDSKTYDVDDSVDVTTGDSIATDSFTTGNEIADYALVGYGVDDNGVIDSLDGTAVVTTGAFVVKSPSVLSIGGTDYPIKKDATIFSVDLTGSDSYDVISMDDLVDTSNYTLTTSGVTLSAIIDADNHNVVALLVDAADATGGSGDAYAVANNFDESYDATLDDTVYNFVGLADGAAIDKNTSDDTPGATPATGNSDINLYELSYNADGYIDSISEVTTGVVTGAVIGTDNDKTNLQISGGAWYQIADTAKVYQAADFGTSDKEYKASNLGAIKATTASTTYNVYLYETDSDEDGYDVVIWYKN